MFVFRTPAGFSVCFRNVLHVWQHMLLPKLGMCSNYGLDIHIYEMHFPYISVGVYPRVLMCMALLNSDIVAAF